MRYIIITIMSLVILTGIPLDSNDNLQVTRLKAKSSADSTEVQFVVVSVQGPTSVINGFYKFSQVYNDTIDPLGLFIRTNNIYYSALETHDFGWVDVYSVFSSSRILFTPFTGGYYFISFPPDSLKETSFELSDQIKTPEILSFVYSDSVKGDSLWRRVAKTDILDSISMTSNFEVYVIKQNSSTEWFIIAQSVIFPVGIDDEDHTLSISYKLNQNYPNPFNPVTNISYTLPISSEVSLIIYNLLGDEVARLVDGFQQAGEYNTTWNASNVSSGIYFYRLRSGNFVQTRKMVLLK
ncbi:MAG: T9SS type A sorting domain-containing protein [Candidatus Marinimicrobia bacterium]|nr:T9SS type A sorting domain-containing protein [Candidatus Neomarinimicrobiota bacterium]